MRIEADGILAAFEGVTLPVTAHEIAAALDLSAGDMHMALSECVRNGTLERVRNGDGVMRYRLAGSQGDDNAQTPSEPEATATPPIVPVTISPSVTADAGAGAPMPASKAPKKNPPVMNGSCEDVLSVIRSAEKPISNPEIRATLGEGKYTSQQITSAVGYLRKQGKICATGKNSGTRWTLASAHTTPPPYGRFQEAEAGQEHRAVAGLPCCGRDARQDAQGPRIFGACCRRRFRGLFGQRGQSQNLRAPQTGARSGTGGVTCVQHETLK